MKIVAPYMKMTGMDHGTGLRMLRDVEAIGRVSHRSEDLQSDESWQRFIQNVVLDHGDWSITEHVVVRVEALIDRGISHEVVRHRIGAYTQESTRFVNYEKKMPPSFVYPFEDTDCQCLCDPTLGHVRVSGGGFVHWRDGKAVGACTLNGLWMEAVHACETSYRNLILTKVSPQIARSVFPNALSTKLIITYNLRSWRHFFLMRTSKEAHPQMRQVTIPLLAEFQQQIPLLFDDIEPNARQADNLKKGR